MRVSRSASNPPVQLSAVAIVDWCMVSSRATTSSIDSPFVVKTASPSVSTMLS